MTQQIEAMKLAIDKAHATMKAAGQRIGELKAENAQLRQAIEQAQKQEPVAFINVEKRELEWAKYTSWNTPTVVNLPKIPLYTSPPQRQPEQEPVAWLWELTGEVTTDPDRADGLWLPLYTSPPQRQWVGLTDEEIDEYFDEQWCGYSSYHDCFKEVMCWQEAKLKEKNT